MTTAYTPKVAGESGFDVAHQVLGTAMSVSPFLPPPWNAGVTAGLSLVNFLITAFEPDKPPPPNPFDVLGQNLEAFVVAQEVRQQLGKIQGAGDNYSNAAAALTTPLPELKKVGKAVTDLDARIKTEFRVDVDSALSDLFTLLDECTTEKYKDVLDVICAGVTTSLLLWSAEIEIAATTATVAKRNGDAQQFDDAADYWITMVRNASNDLDSTAPTTTQEPDAATTAGTPDAGKSTAARPTSYIPKIETWIADAIDTRIENVAVVQLAAHAMNASGHASSSLIPGWTFSDPVHGNTYQEQHANWKQDRQAAQTARDAYCASLRPTLEKQFDSYRTVMASWRTFVSGFNGLLPLPQPEGAPDVAPKKDGPSTPTRLWINGTRVRYAIAATNVKGPSQAGPWSSEYLVGDTAFTTLTLPAPPGADGVDVYRQMRPPGQDWQAMSTVAVVKPLVSVVDDTDDIGGDAW